MKKLLLLFIHLLFMFPLLSQVYWQQKADFKINVTLNESEKSITGDLLMAYTNNSPDTLSYLWMHLWPNAYKNDKTAFSDQLLENNKTDFYFTKEENHGYINRLSFKSGNVILTTEDHPQHQDIIKIILPVPLLPGQQTIIETPFNVKLPYKFSRSGFIEQSFSVTQWYPKPAVYDRKGWHPMPYLELGEFYSEFGRYEVNITLPKKYMVAATGSLVNTTETDINKTYFFQQDSVHDFAWFASKDFIVSHDTMQLPGKIINVYSYYREAKKENWKNSLAYIKAAIASKSNLLGEYPYNTVSVVEDPDSSFAGGMEYPTITSINNPGNEELLNFIIHHEVGHNWFYGILATHERNHPWMDEGMNSYYDRRYAEQTAVGLIDYMDVKSSFLKKRMPEDAEDLLLRTLIAEKKDQPINTLAHDFTLLNYNAIPYYKTSQWMSLLEKEVGRPLFDSIMRTYYSRWKFKHPYPEDFKSIVDEMAGKKLEGTFALLDKKGSISPGQEKKLKITSFFSLRETAKTNYIFIAPAIGYNMYDKLMAGGIIHNYTLPLSRLRFFAAPLYATGSKQLNGLGRIGFSHFIGKHSFELALAGARFSGNVYTDSTNTKNFMPFSKIVPSFRLTFANKYPRSTVRKFIQLKSFLINETGILFSRDPVTQADVITYPVSHRYVNQFRFVIENNRMLYPFKFVLQADQGDGFIRPDITANYFFNYPRGGGLVMRFYAGKFMYTSDRPFIRQFDTDRYHLNLSGAKGNEDYTYSNYFFGRREFEGLSSQQIMIRDGGFKVKTDLLSSKVGKTDDWLSAVNFNTTIPKEINPLELLPVKIPLKIFADVGTFAEAWEEDAGGSRFLFDAGLQVSLFKDVVNIYIPIVYSKVYRDYFKSTITEKRFIKNISFSIDLQNISFYRIFPQIPF